MKKRLEQRIVKGEPIKLIQRLEMRFAEGELRESLKQKNEGIKLKESAGGNGKRKLIVTVEGIHTGMTKNLTFYPGETLEASVPTWTSPHKKPILKNHNEYSEPLGRIIHAEYVESTLTAGKFTVRMKLEITDQEAIDKVLDGRYLTLSVGGSANKVVCSTCGKNLVSEGFCGHWRGKKYEGKSEPTHWIIGEYTGDEISFVNMPADVYSQVIAAELVTGEGGDGVKKAKNKKQDKPGETSEKQGKKLGEMSDIDLVGQLTEDDHEDDEQEDFEDDIEESADDDDSDDEEDAGGDDGGDEDNADDAGDNSADGGEGGEDGDDSGDDESLEEKVKRLEALIAEKDETIGSLTARAEQAEAQNATLTAQLSEANTTIQDLQGQLQEAQQNLASAEEERNTFQEQNLRLARFSKKLLAERVVDLRIMQGKDKAEDRESLLESWMQSTPKVLESTIQDLLKSGQRQVKRVTSPGLAVGEDVEGGDGDITESTAKKPNKAPTMADLEETMVRTMSQRV
jgi:hypothetical protein